MHIPPLLDELKLEAQASFFKVTILANFVVVMKPPLDCNPCSRMWALLTINQITCFNLLEWLKLVELSMVGQNDRKHSPKRKTPGADVRYIVI